MARPVPEQFRCVALKPDGQRCTLRARLGHDTCRVHDPDDPVSFGAPPPERRCTARITGGATRKDKAGQRCGEWAMTGQNVCRVHGGSTGQARRAVAVRVAMQHARQLMNTYGQRLETTPLDALLAEVQWTAGHVAWLRTRVQQIESGEFAALVAEDPLVWGVTKRKIGGDDEGLTEEAVPNAILRLYQQERTHLARVCEIAIRAGLDERLVKLAENRGQMVAQAIRAILGDLQLTPQQWAMVPQIVPARLRELTAASLN